MPIAMYTMSGSMGARQEHLQGCSLPIHRVCSSTSTVAFQHGRHAADTQVKQSIRKECASMIRGPSHARIVLQHFFSLLTGVCKHMGPAHLKSQA